MQIDKNWRRRGRKIKVIIDRATCDDRRICRDRKLEIGQRQGERKGGQGESRKGRKKERNGEKMKLRVMDIFNDLKKTNKDNDSISPAFDS